LASFTAWGTRSATYEKGFGIASFGKLPLTAEDHKLYLAAMEGWWLVIADARKAAMPK
jgi:hypothetical protein